LEYSLIIPGTEFTTHGDGRSQILGYGPMDILVKRVDGSMEELRLNKVFHAPGFMANVVFAEEAEEWGFFWNRRQQYIETQPGLSKWKTFKYRKQRFIAKTAVEPDDGILAGEMSATMYNSKSSSTSTTDHSIWHNRLGHLNREAINHLPEAVLGIQIEGVVDKNKDICESCVEGKIQCHISPFPKDRGQHAFDKIHLDIIVISDTAFNGDHILHLYDSFSHSHAVSTLPGKTQSILFKEV
jgi:hypothetical protein